MSNHSFITRFTLLIAALAVCASAALAQPPSFSYQGKLTDAGNPANGTFDLQFALFDALSGGAQQGALLTRDDVTVTNGIFTVQLDFGAGAFPGGSRFLEISVRPGASTGAFTLLTPRQAVNSTPYALRSLNAGNATSADALSAVCQGCVNTAHIGSVAGSVIAGQIPVTSVPAGSNSYIQNNGVLQANSSFNVSGNGSAGGTLSGNIVNASAQFNLSGSRILSNAGAANLFAGTNSGLLNTSAFNAFFGTDSGAANTTGSSNAFFGASTGTANSSGEFNTFVGQAAGAANTLGSNNTLVGKNAGRFNTQGNDNSFFGQSAGDTNTTGNNNTVIGSNADVGINNLTFATALGAGAVVSTSNTIVLGRNTETVNVPGALTVIGALTANGSGLTNLNASNISTGTLGVARGGTGLSAAGAAGNVLRSDGTNWTSAALQAADIPTGSANYIQNSNSLQASSNFNISGNGTAGGTLSGNIVNATTQFNLNGDRILSNAGGNGVNLFAGAGAGSSNTSGTSNSFFGSNAGLANTDGSVNSFFGGLAGDSNTQGNNNSFFGGSAGSANTGGSNNSFFGAFTGDANTTGDGNSFFGGNAGGANTTGFQNAFFGLGAGSVNTTGSSNTIIGSGANVAANNLTFATAIGSEAVVSTSNSVLLGRTADTVRVPGALAVTGTATVTGNLTISGNTIITLGAAGATAVCRNASNQLSTCSSSRRYKENILAYRAGLQLVNGLRPVTFNWKADRQHDLGLVAEEVAALEPLLATYNDKGEVEGVKYDRVAVVLLNAVKEQQQQIEQLQAEKVALEQRLSALENLVQQNRSTHRARARAVR